MSDGRSTSTYSGENLLFLTDEQLRQGIEAMFFAYRGFTADPDRILADMAYGRAHHRAIHFHSSRARHNSQQLAQYPRCNKAIIEPRFAHADRTRVSHQQSWQGR